MLQELLLSEELEIPGLPSMSSYFSEPFPCLADELEQQAKALEFDW